MNYFMNHLTARVTSHRNSDILTLTTFYKHHGTTSNSPPRAERPWVRVARSLRNGGLSPEPARPLQRRTPRRSTLPQRTRLAAPAERAALGRGARAGRQSPDR